MIGNLDISSTSGIDNTSLLNYILTPLGLPRLLTDENFNGAILRGLMRRLPELDIVRAQDVSLMNTDDPDILEWAATEGRILLTHDVATITMYAYERINQGLSMVGVVEVISTAPIGKIIDDLELFICCSEPNEYENQILFIPFS